MSKAIMPQLAIVLLLSFLIIGCEGGKPFDPPTAGEIPSGPGLFSGEDGEFKLYRK